MVLLYSQCELSVFSSLQVTFFADQLSAILARLISIRKVQFLGFITSIIGVGLGAIATEYWHTVILLGVVSGEFLISRDACRCLLDLNILYLFGVVY